MKDRIRNLVRIKKPNWKQLLYLLVFAYVGYAFIIGFSNPMLSMTMFMVPVLLVAVLLVLLLFWEVGKSMIQVYHELGR